MALLSVLAMGFAFSTRKAGALVRNFKEETLAYEAGLRAFEDARTYILEDRDLTIDFSGPDGALRTDAERPPFDGMREIGGINVKAKITDEESKLNINMLDENGIVSALKSSGGVPDAEIQGIADSIMDWTDPDDLHRLGGAEDFYYEHLDDPYISKDSAFETVDELSLVKGVKPEYVISPDGSEARLSRFLTAFGEGININTSPRENLIASGIDPALADYIMSFRSEGGQGLRALPPGLNMPVRPIAYSNNFRVLISASVPGSQRVYNIVSVLRRVRDEKGIRLETAFWKETFGYGGD